MNNCDPKSNTSFIDNANSNHSLQQGEEKIDDQQSKVMKQYNQVQNYDPNLNRYKEVHEDSNDISIVKHENYSSNPHNNQQTVVKRGRPPKDSSSNIEKDNSYPTEKQTRDKD